MYKSYKLLTFIVNTSGGESETIEHLYKDGTPLTKEEAILKLFDKMSSMGANAATRAIKCMLFDNNGGMIKSEELVKPEVNAE